MSTYEEQFQKDPRKLAYVEIDSETSDVDRLMMRSSYGTTDSFIQGRQKNVPGAGMEGRLPITGGRVGHFIAKDGSKMVTYYFDKIRTSWVKSVYHFPAGTVFPKAGAITFNSNSSWKSYKSYHRFPFERIQVITIS